MPYWVYGLRTPSSADPLGIRSAQPQPADPLFIEADTEEAARAKAQELGMLVESVEFVQARAKQAPTVPQPTPSPEEGEHRVASVLITVFRVLAAICGLLTLIQVGMALDVASRLGAAGAAAVIRAILQGVAVVAILLAVSEGLRLGIAIERNTRGNGPMSMQGKKHRKN
jgi:hypothetical protein